MRDLKLYRLLIIIVSILFSTTIFAQTEYKGNNKPDSLYNDINLEYSKIPSTSIQIKPPKYFEMFSSETFNGFMHKGSAASIIGFEYKDVAYNPKSDTLKQENFTTQGVRLIGSEVAKTEDGLPCKFYFVTFQVDNVDIIRVMFFTGSYYKMVHLQANYPMAFDGVLRKAIMESFLTVKFE